MRFFRFLLLPAVLLPTLAAAILLKLAHRYRTAFHRAIYFVPRSPIPLLSLSEVDPLFAESQHGVTTAAEVQYLGSGGTVLGGTSDTESWILSVLAKRSEHAFEFGTCTGHTTYNIAKNLPPGGTITTLTLPPSGLDEYVHVPSDNTIAREHAKMESAFTSFVYSGTEVVSKVTQLFGDSKRFDVSGHQSKYDLIFIDGSHAYSYIKQDTINAFKMLAPNGIILWHDYRAGQDLQDVRAYLQELLNTKKLQQIAGTSLVMYRELP